MRLGTGLRSDVVTVDEEGGAYEAVAHLLRLGYTRIGMLNGPNVSTSRRRFVGYQQALKAWRRRVDPSLVVASDFRVEAGYESGITLLRRRPDAVFVANYLMAVGFMQALRQYQIRCPEDIGLVTCDDHPWLDGFAPRLTTINLPKYRDRPPRRGAAGRSNRAGGRRETQRREGHHAQDGPSDQGIVRVRASRDAPPAQVGGPAGAGTGVARAGEHRRSIVSQFTACEGDGLHDAYQTPDDGAGAR